MVFKSASIAALLLSAYFFHIHLTWLIFMCKIWFFCRLIIIWGKLSLIFILSCVSNCRSREMLNPELIKMEYCNCNFVLVPVQLGRLKLLRNTQRVIVNYWIEPSSYFLFLVSLVCGTVNYCKFAMLTL